MADDEQISQDEIEALLNNAAANNAAADDAAAAGPSESADDPMASLGQDEIEALISGAPTSSPGAGAAASPPPAAAMPAGVGPAPTPVVQSDMEYLLSQAEAAIASIDEPTELPPGVQPFDLADLSGTPPTTEAATIELVRDVQLDLKIELGRTHMHLEDVLRMKAGSVVPLDKMAGDPVDIYVNGRLIARGEVLVLNDNFCVRVTQLVAGESAVA
ncbi:MAG: flagellar motor switch protein FliN [Planctomycetota bacterium]